VSTNKAIQQHSMGPQDALGMTTDAEAHPNVSIDNAVPSVTTSVPEIDVRFE
jgi:hypothetical protein